MTRTCAPHSLTQTFLGLVTHRLGPVRHLNCESRHPASLELLPLSFADSSHRSSALPDMQCPRRPLARACTVYQELPAWRTHDEIRAPKKL